MMTTVTISAKWYNDIKDLVKTENPYFYTDTYGSDTRDMVEVDIDEEAYITVATELGWM